MPNNFPPSSKPTTPPVWANPIIAISAILGCSILIFLLTPDYVFYYQFRQQKSSPSIALQLYGASYISIVIGITLGLLAASAFIRKDNPTANSSSLNSPHFIVFLGWISLLLTLLGYAIYFSTSRAPPSLYLSALAGNPGSNYALKAAFDKIPGLTSFMNLACWWYVYVGHRTLVSREKITFTIAAPTLILTLLCLVRAFAVNERRVIFEILVPVVSYLSFALPSGRFARRVLYHTPILLASSLVIVFLSTEYFRSWVNHYAEELPDTSYATFALSRLGGYYTTAMNNGVALYTYEIPTSGYLTFGGLMKAPLIKDALGMGELRNSLASNYTASLQQLTNPEYNSPGGIIAPIIDFGLISGSTIIFITGIFFGFSYQRACLGGNRAILLYTIIFFSILEASRLWYLGSANGVISLAFLASASAIWPFLARARVKGRSSDHS